MAKTTDGERSARDRDPLEGLDPGVAEVVRRAIEAPPTSRAGRVTAMTGRDGKRDKRGRPKRGTAAIVPGHVEKGSHPLPSESKDER